MTLVASRDRDRTGVIVGLGLRAVTTTEDLLGAVREGLTSVGLTAAQVAGIATWSERANHPAVVAAAEMLGVRLHAVATDTLRRQPVTQTSERVAALTGGDGDRAVPSVAEASALAVAGADHEVVLTRAVVRGCTVSIVRPGVASVEGVDLEHHGDADIGAGLLDFAVNVAVPTPPPWLKDALTRAVHDVAAYPDPRPAEVAVAAAAGIDPRCVLVLNGAAEGFTLVARARRWRRPVVVHPQFTEPEAALRDAGFTVHRHLLTRESGFRLNPTSVETEADLVVVGNPTNPTSRLHPSDDLSALRRPGRLLVVDEAFCDVVPHDGEPQGPSLLAAAAEHPGLLVVRSLTKTFGLAGLRAGYAVAHPDEIAALRAVQQSWSVNSLALEAIRSCVDPGAPTAELARAHVAAVRARIRADRPRLVETLTRHGLDVVDDPQGPFVLASHPRACHLRLALRRRGVAVRRGDTFPGLGDTWLRVAVRDAATVARLDAALGDSLHHLAPNDPASPSRQEQR